MSKETKAQKIHRIVGEIEKSIRAEENHRQDALRLQEEHLEADQKLSSQRKVTKILRDQLEAETSTMRKAKGE